MNMNLKSWNRFNVNGLSVPPELMSMVHRFQFEGAFIEVKLPKSTDADRGPNFDTIASLSSWRGNSKQEVFSYRIHRVDVEVNRGTCFDVDPAVLLRSPNATDLIPDDLQKLLEMEAQQLLAIASRAFVHWLSVMQWATDNHRIGHLETESHTSGWATYLVHGQDKGRVWGATQTITVALEKNVTSSQWQTAEANLVADEKPPLYVLLKHDALRLLHDGNYRRSIVELAICCETFLRNRVLGSLPSLPQDIWKHVEEGNINQYVSKFFPNILSQEGKDAYKPLKEELQSLMSKRNDIVHRGNSDGATEANCLRFALLVSRLLVL